MIHTVCPEFHAEFENEVYMSKTHFKRTFKTLLMKKCNKNVFHCIYSNFCAEFENNT